MALPKIQYAMYDITIPSTQKKVKFRPMLVKEEKILLMAKQSEERADQLNAIKQVVNNCCTDLAVYIEELTYFDLEYIFLKIREQSVSNIVKVSYRDNEDDKVYDFEIDISKIEVDMSNAKSPTIELGDDISIVLSYPSVKTFTAKEFFDLKQEEVFDYLLANCITKVFQEDKLYDIKSSSKQEIKEFIESIPSKQYEKIQEFFENVPNLYYKIEYRNEKGTDRKIELKSLEDFFTF